MTELFYALFSFAPGVLSFKPKSNRFPFIKPLRRFLTVVESLTESRAEKMGLRQFIDDLIVMNNLHAAEDFVGACEKAKEIAERFVPYFVEYWEGIPGKKPKLKGPMKVVMEYEKVNCPKRKKYVNLFRSLFFVIFQFAKGINPKEMQEWTQAAVMQVMTERDKMKREGLLYHLMLREMEALVE